MSSCKHLNAVYRKSGISGASGRVNGSERTLHRVPNHSVSCRSVCAAVRTRAREVVMPVPARLASLLRSNVFFLLLQDVPHCSGEDHRLHVGRYMAGIQHFVIARLASVEFSQLSKELVGTKDQLFKRIVLGRRCVRTHDSAPPEDGTEEGIIVPLLD